MLFSSFCLFVVCVCVSVFVCLFVFGVFFIIIIMFIFDWWVFCTLYSDIMYDSDPV